RASGRVIDLVNDLLDLDRMKAGKLVLEMTHVQVSAIVEIAIETLEVFANQKQVALIDKTHDATLLADQARIAQVLTNLVSNAVKFSAPGQTVEISNQIEADFCELRVTDQGPGIAPEYTEVIFQQFKQLPGDQAKAGSGLGLAICREIVECHQGEIGVRSQKGQGSTFWFKLPCLATTPRPVSSEPSRAGREAEYNSAT
ncbi:MAG TPA: HAMP domain-containing sensor histidine kinase, partial [Chroococcales cyanobacterium]